MLSILRNTKRTNDVSYIDILLLLSTVLAPMTSWRVWKIGPAEVLCLLACFLCMVKGMKIDSSDNMFADYWNFFLPIIATGTVVCLFRYPSEVTPAQLLTWVYFAFISTVVYEWYKQKSYPYLSRVLLTISYLASLWYLALFVYSRTVSSSFIGASLWYNEVRFTGGATNPHQLALLMAVTGVVLISHTMHAGSWKQFLVGLVNSCNVIWLLFQTKSSTGIMALCVGAAIVMLFMVPSARGRIVVFCLIMAAALLNFRIVYDLFMKWVESDANGLGRIEIFTSITQAFEKSPIVGLGPGTHAVIPSRPIEFHNTYLEVLAMSGLLGSFVFLFFSINVLSITCRNPVCISAVIALYVFGFSGFGMRRLVYWLILPIVVAYAEKRPLQSRRKGSDV